jgi:NADPH2:quinone reductase
MRIKGMLGSATLRFMKAIRVHETGAPEVMRLEEVPAPRPEAGQLLVRIKAIGVNPVETYIRSGKYPVAATLPYTPGSDAAGVIEELGANVKGFAVGDRVYTSGTLTGAYAELALCKETQVHPLAENVSFEQGAGVNIPYATAYRALFIRAQAQPAETLLVHGATGGVGTAATQIARAHGLRVIGTGGTEPGRALVREQGADEVLDHTAAGYLEKLMALTGGRGVNLILEMLANVNLAKDLKVLAKGGRVVVVGSRGTIEIDPRDTMSRDTSILGMQLFHATESELVMIHTAVGAGLRNGTLRPIVGRKFPLAEAAKAHHAVMAPGAHGKIVLV